MSSSPQQDPYQTLGISKDADLAAVKGAYRKLVLKCHPDKIQDAALKAVKQDEFQQVQQAYELLSDDTRRMKYDEQMKLYELRKEMGRGGPPPGQSVFDYQVRTAEPRTSSFRSSPKEAQRPYGQASPRVYDEEPRSSSFEEPLRARARKTSTYEERRRPATRDGERSRRSEEEREHERWEKTFKRNVHEAIKKNRDKERRKGVEEKFSRAYVEDDDSEDAYRPRAETKSSRSPEEAMRGGERWARVAEKLLRKEKEMDMLTDRAKKLDIKLDTKTKVAVQYMQDARRKAEPEMDPRPKPVRRAETFPETPYTIRHAAPPSPYVEDDDSPRRSSASRAVPTRRASEQIPAQSRSSGKERRTSPYDRDAYIVEASPPSPPDPPRRKPPLQSYTSEPPILSSASRKEPHRSKTFQSEYTRRESTTAPPPLPRASTFQAGDKSKSSSRGSNLKTQMHYGNDSSDSDDYSPRRTTRREPPLETTRRYVYDKGRTVPLERYRSALREDNYENPRDRSESPRDTRGSAERPPLARSGGSGNHHSSYSRGYSSHSPDPIIKEARPKMPARDSTGGGSNRGPYFGEVKYATQFGPEHVRYSPDGYRRGSDPTHHRDFAYPPKPSREMAYT
jgi:curved DNA-binding protein CbpA